VARLLLEHKAEVDAKDNDGETALQLAAENGHEVVVRLLVEKGADINTINYDEGTALDRVVVNTGEIPSSCLPT
jgi:ankyrin repeat protein